MSGYPPNAAPKTPPGEGDTDILSLSMTKPRNPRDFDKIEGGRVYQALYLDSKSVLDALCRVKKCLRRSI